MLLPKTVLAPESKQFNPYPDQDLQAVLRQLCKKCAGKSFVQLPFDRVRFVVLDIETTGFEADNGDEVISLAAVEVINGRVNLNNAINLLVNPYRPIPARISNLTGIHNHMVAGAMTVYQAVKEFLQLLDGGVIAGHALGFDIGFLNYKLARARAGKIQGMLYDTKIVARYLNPLLDDYSLDSLLAATGIQPRGRHSALGDCLLTAELLLDQLTRLQQRKVDNLWQLYNMLNQNRGSCSF